MGQEEGLSWCQLWAGSEVSVIKGNTLGPHLELALEGIGVKVMEGWAWARALGSLWEKPNSSVPFEVLPSKNLSIYEIFPLLLSPPLPSPPFAFPSSFPFLLPLSLSFLTLGFATR